MLIIIDVITAVNRFKMFLIVYLLLIMIMSLFIL